MTCGCECRPCRSSTGGPRRPTANGQPAWGEYRRDPVTGALHLSGVEVITHAGDRVSEVARFETAVAAHFGLPRILG